MADIDKLSIRISASAGTAIKNVNNLASALSNLNAQLNAIDASRLNGISQTFSGLNNAVTGLRGSGRTIRSVVNAMASVGQSSTGVAQATSAAQGLATAANQAAQSTSGAATATQNLGNAGQQSANGVRQLSNACQNVARRTRASAGSMRSFSNATRSASISSKGLVKELTRVGKMLKLMVTRMVLRKVIEGVLDGFKNLAQYSTTFDATLSLLWNSLRQLGNSIAAAASPLLNALAPALNYIIQLCIKAVNVINQLISALFGLKTFTRAKTLTDDYAKSLDKANGSAKKLKNTVLSFDELNQLQDNDSGGGGGGGTSPANMFEEVPIDQKILDFIDELKSKIGELKPLWDAFLKGFKKGLGDDWKDKVAQIVDGVARIQKALGDIWNNPEVKAARDRYFLSLAETLGAIAGTVARIGLNIGVNLAQGIAASLEQKTPEIQAYLVEMFDIGTAVNKQVEEFALAIGKISDVLTGSNAIAATKAFTNLFLESFMLITENAARLGEDIVTLVTQPIIDNQNEISTVLDDLFGILGNFADFVQGLIKDVRDVLSDAWNRHIHPMFGNLTSAISDLMKTALNAWHNNIQPVINEAINAIRELWSTYFQPIFTDIINIITSVGNIVSMVVKSIIIPRIKDMIDIWFPQIQSAISGIITWVKTLAEIWSTAMEHMLWRIRTLLEFIETLFTQGWDAAWDYVADSWTQHWEDMKEKLRGILNSIIELVEKFVNAIVRAINTLADKISEKLSIEFPEWLGGGSFNIDIPHLDSVSLPRFASGGFPNMGSLFLAGEAGAELVGNINGRTGVANNEQITAGIAQAVYSAIVSANAQGGSEHYINNTIYVDDVAIARAVTKGQDKLSRRYSPTMA